MSLALSLVYTYDASISIRNLRVNRCDGSISALCLRLCLRRPGLHVRRNEASISTSTREWNDFHSLVLVLVLASLRRTCKPGRRKHKYKRKEGKLKNSDKLSAYILVTHALPFTPNFYASALAYVTLDILVLMLMLASYV